MKTVVLDGERFDDLRGFYDEVERQLLPPGAPFGRNLDALADLLSGSLSPEDAEPLTVRWLQAARSRRALGHAETVRVLESRLAQLHPSNRAAWQTRLEAARRGVGETLFDELVRVFREAPDLHLELVDDVTAPDERP